mgnify:CR=1 FL=1
MFEVIDIQPKIGSEVRIDRDAFLAGTYAKQIEQLLVERSALVFREINLTGEEQRQFGPLQKRVSRRVARHRGP